MSDFEIYTGSWTLQEHGPVFGRVLTLPSDRALILISFITLFVRFAGSRLWKIVAFFLHRVRSTATPQDGLYHHQQVVLRNMESDSTALVGLLNVGWRWREKAPRSKRRTLGLSIVAAVHLGLLLTAALFVKNMATTSGDNVLIASSAEKCGFVAPPDAMFRQPTLEDVMMFGSWRTMTLRLLQNSADYVRACYRGKHVSAKTCAFYNQPSLNSKQSNAACPFDEEICGGSSEWVHYASEFVESARDLGINARPEDGVKLRKSTACGVLDEKMFEKTQELNQPLRDTWSEYHLGSTNQSEFTYGTSQLWQNFTWQPYKLAAFSYFPTSLISSFQPIPRLNVTGADLSIFFLENLATYHVLPVMDPWFSATEKYVQPFTDTDIYRSSKTLSILACTETYEYCNARMCTTPAGLFEAQLQARQFDFHRSEGSKSVFNLMVNGSSIGTVANAVGLLMDKVLLAQNFLWAAAGNDSSPLPADQWKREVENLHNISMASLQLNIVGHISPMTLVETNSATGELSGSGELKILHGTTEQDRALCKVQMVRSDAHISFNVFGMSLILGVGFVIIVLSFTIDRLVFWGGRKAMEGSGTAAKRREWVVDDMLQLFRAAVDGRGVGPWTGWKKSVPILLEPGVKFTLEGISESGEVEEGKMTGLEDYRSYHESRLLEVREVK